MAILLRQGEEIDGALKRLKRGVSGLIREVRERTSYATKSQKRRAKSKRARTARRKLAVKLAIINRRRESSFRKPEGLSYDVDWPVTGMNVTYVDGEKMIHSQPKRVAVATQTETAPVGPAEAAGFGEDQRKTETVKEMTYHVSVIAPKLIENIPCFILVKSRNDDGSVRNGYSAPGGGKDKNETTRQCGKREMLQETGFKIKTLKKADQISELDYENHTAFCYAGTITGGSPKMQKKEIVELKAFPVSQVYTIKFMQYCLLPKYRKYFIDYKDFLEKRDRTDLEEQVFQSILASELYRDEGEVAAHV